MTLERIDGSDHNLGPSPGGVSGYIMLDLPVTVLSIWRRCGCLTDITAGGITCGS